MKLLVLSLLVCAAMASCPYRCDLSWSSYNGRLYKLFTSARTWVDAQRHCVSLGGSLASVHNNVEEHFVKTVAKRKEAWIGLTDAQEDGQWAWINSNHFDFANWCQGEPSNFAGAQHSERRCWDDQECRRLLPYVCMRKSIKPTVAHI